MAYDAQNRLVSTTDCLGVGTQSNYNCCQLVSIVDAENQMTAYAYKPLSGFGFSTGATGCDDEDRVKNWNRADGNQNQAKYHDLSNYVPPASNESWIKDIQRSFQRINRRKNLLKAFFAGAGLKIKNVK